VPILTHAVSSSKHFVAMGAKRAAASQSLKPRTRPKKEAMVAKATMPEPQSEPVVAPPDWCLPALGLLETPVANAELPLSCRETVAAMLTNSGLNSQVGGRHMYQQQFLQSLSENFMGIQTSCQAAVATAKTQIAALGSEQAEVLSKVGIAKERANDMRAVRDGKQQMCKKATEAITEIRKAILAAEELVKNHEAEHKQSQEEVDRLGQLLTTKFTPLKEFSIPGTQRRLHDKTTREVADALASTLPAGVEDSLRDALQVAFRRTPADEESFAVMTIEYAETLVSKHRENLYAKIKSYDTEALSRAAAVASAKEAAEEARKCLDVFENDYIVADNQLLEIDALANEAAHEEKQLNAKAEELAIALETAEADLGQVQSFIDNFEAMRAGLPASAAVAETAGHEASAQGAAVEAPAEKDCVMTMSSLNSTSR